MDGIVLPQHPVFNSTCFEGEKICTHVIGQTARIGRSNQRGKGSTLLLFLMPLFSISEMEEILPPPFADKEKEIPEDHDPNDPEQNDVHAQE